MRITYLHQYFKTPDQAGGTRSYEMGRRLVNLGHEVHIVTSASHDSDGPLGWTVTEVAGMQVHSINVAYSNRMGYARRIVAFVTFALASAFKAAQLPADVIFATSTPLTIAIPARFGACRRRIPYVLEVRDLWPKVPIALGALKDPVSIAAARALERWAYRGAARVVVLAPGMGRHVETVGYPRERIRVIENGCDCDIFTDDLLAQDLRKTHSWAGDRRLVVYAGTIGLVNGVGWLVEVASHVKNIDPGIRFVVVGDGREAQHVRNRAIELGVLNDTFFMLGELPKRVAAAWVRTSDVVVSLILDEEYFWENAVSNKFFDALAAARPVFSNHPGYQTDVAVEADVGKMLDAHDHELAARQLVASLNDSEWLEAASSAAAALAQDRFSRDRLAAMLSDTLLGAQGGPREREEQASLSQGGDYR